MDQLINADVEIVGIANSLSPALTICIQLTTLVETPILCINVEISTFFMFDFVTGL